MTVSSNSLALKMTVPIKISGNVLLVAVLLTLATCKVASSQKQGTSLDKLITDRLGKEVVAENNPGGSYRLYKQPTGGHVSRLYKYIVIRLSDESIAAEGTYRMGYVKWKDDVTLEVVTSEGQAAGANQHEDS